MFIVNSSSIGHSNLTSEYFWQDYLQKLYFNQYCVWTCPDNITIIVGTLIKNIYNKKTKKTKTKNNNNNNILTV